MAWTRARPPKPRVMSEINQPSHNSFGWERRPGEGATESRRVKGRKASLPTLQPCGKHSIGQRVCIFRIALLSALLLRDPVGAAVSQFLSVLLLATAVTLTVCFGVAAWRQSEGRDVDITATIPHQEYGWRTRPSN